eukprot:CAMPEP_0185825550 /NCGR_PEP_ID=MMETSP1322-20130828/31101_1 /TAXON_ID=265543 /ORGANISM="Minutocellus polymorphus, Strain RCC2270" /LENGTH=379 /DNA_ID=CAMNT_0028523273 /DNA_START=261 /DNA_END=1399 /DNA_ORIENTATION=-
MEVYEDVHHQISSPPTDMPSPSSVASTPSPDATVPHPSADASKAGGRRWRPGKTKPSSAEFETPSLNASTSSGFGARKKQNTSRSRPNDQSQSSSVAPRSPARPLSLTRQQSRGAKVASRKDQAAPRRIRDALPERFFALRLRCALHVTLSAERSVTVVVGFSEIAGTALSLTRPRWAEQAQDTSLVDDDHDVEMNLNGSILLDKDDTTSPTSKTPNSSGGRADGSGLVSILKNFAECGDTDYLVCGTDGCGGTATDNDGAALPYNRRRHSLFDSCSDRPATRATSPDRTISSRVSFSDDRLVVVHEFPRMSATEKSQSFYSARELHTIRQDAREARLQQAEIDEDCAFFCGDFYDTFCVQEMCGGEEIASRGAIYTGE